MPRILLFSFFACLLALPGRPVAAQQDPLADFTDPLGQLNALVPSLADDRRADLILGRALGETAPAPDVIDAMENVSLLIPGDPEWDAGVAWVSGEKQQSALESLREATDRRADNVFALPYGDALPADLTRIGFTAGFTDGKLYQPEVAYFDLLERCDEMVWIEANRLAEAGEGMDAAELLVSMVRLGRMLADRPLLLESMLGYGLMIETCERLRDLVYRYPELLDARDSKRIIRLLEERTLRLDRLGFPAGGEIAVKQAILDMYERMGRGDAEAIASVIDEPVSETEPADYYEAVDVAEKIFADWRLRWPLGVYDILMERPSYFMTASAEQGDRLRGVLLTAGMHDALFEMRLSLRSELIGTRLGLGAIGYRNEFGAWPKPIVAIRPAFVRQIDIDPYDPKEADQMRYFVPIRDQDWDARETPHPHTVTLHVGLEGQKYASMATKAAQRVIEDARATSSVQTFIAAMTTMGLEPRNFVEKISTMNDPELQRIVPPHLAAQAESLSGDALKLFTQTMVETALYTEGFERLKELFGVSTDPRERRRRTSRNRDVSLDPQDISLARVLAVAQSRVGVPLSRRLSREEMPDPGVTVFKVDLTADDFVVYSVGDDGAANWAEQSGLDGTDIMYWPPVISLYREHTGG